MASGENEPDPLPETQARTEPGGARPIPADVEDRVLEILDSTEPGAERDAALAELGLPDDVAAAVADWLAEDDEGSEFLATPAGTPAGREGFELAQGALPRRMGDYELFAVLGKGGMGIVYAARDLKLGREVALKVLPEHFADNPKRLQRFEREVRAVASLRHRNIVSVLEAGTIQRTPYFTMELVDGQSLDKVIQRLHKTGIPLGALRHRHWLQAVAGGTVGSAPDGRERTYLEAVCQLTIDVADALQHAHDKRIVHRDVKPSNIMLLPDGSARLCDFGLARQETDGAMTRTSELIGSPHYMSPEQVRGTDLDHRTDVYSLGVTLYELLTLQVPFDGRTAQELYHAIVNTEPRRPAQLNPQLPKDLETICLTALEKRADRRYQTALDLAEDLRRFLRYEPILARPIGRVTRGARWLRRNRTATSIAVLALAVVVTLLLNMSTTKEKNEALGAVQKLSDEVDAVQREVIAKQREIDEKKKDLDRIERERKRAQGEFDTARGQLEKARTSLADLDASLMKTKGALEEQRALVEKEQHRTETLKAEKTQLQKERDDLQRTLTTLGQQQKELNLDLAAKKTALTGLQEEFGSLQKNHAITTINRLLMEARLLRESNPGLGMIVAHEAAQLAGDMEGSLRTRVDDTLLALLQATQEQLTFTGHQYSATSVAYAPDGSQLVSASSHGDVHVWSRVTGRSVVQLPPQPAAVVHVEYVAQKLVLLARESGELVLWNTGSDAPPQTLEFFRHQRGDRRHVSPHRRFIVGHVDEPSGGLRATQLTTPRSYVIGAEGVRYAAFAFSPTGASVLATTVDSRVQVIDLADGRIRADVRSASMPLGLTFDATGLRAAWVSADSSVRVMNVADQAVVLDVKINDGAPLGTGRIAFCDEDRTLIVTGAGSPDHYLLDAQSGALVARVPADADLRDFEVADRGGHLCCVPTRDGRFRLLSTHSGRVLAELGGHAEVSSPHPPQVAFSPVGDEVATVHGDSTVRVWKTSPGGALVAVGPRHDRRPTEPPEQLRHARFAADGQHLWTIGDHGVSRWRRRSGRREFFAHDVHLPAPDSLTDAHGSRSVTVHGGRILHTRGGERIELPLLQPGDRRLEHATTWPGGRFALTMSPSAADPRREFRLVAEDGTILRRFPLPGGPSGGGIPTASPDGRRLVVGYDQLNVVDTEHPERPVRLPFAQRPCAFSPDGRRIVATTGFEVRVFDAGSGAVLCTLKDLPRDYSQLTCASFAPDGRRVATGWSDGTVRLHECETVAGQLLIDAEAHRQQVRSLEFNGDGSLLLTCADDHMVRLLSSQDGRPRLAFDAGAPCLEARFGPGFREVLCTCADVVQVFPVHPGDAAAARGPRALTDAERDRFGLSRLRSTGPPGAPPGSAR